jgi:hypothetical protein
LHTRCPKKKKKYDFTCAIKIKENTWGIKKLSINMPRTTHPYKYSLPLAVNVVMYEPAEKSQI